MATAISGSMLQAATIARELPATPKADGAPQMSKPMPEIIPAHRLSEVSPEAQPLKPDYQFKPARNRMPMAMLASVALHGVVAGAMMVNWSFRSQDDTPPPAAMVVELAVMPASPPVPASEVPPGPEQVEAAPKPKPLDQMKFDPPPQVDPVLKPSFALPTKQEVKPQDSPVVAKEARETTAPPSVPAPPREKAQAPLEGTNSAAPPSDAQQGWLAQIAAKVARNKRYPAQASNAGQQDMVMVTLVVDRQGRLIQASIKKSAGFTLLNNEALATAKRSSPYPAPPKSMTGERFTITVPINFFVSDKRR